MTARPELWVSFRVPTRFRPESDRNGARSLQPRWEGPLSDGMGDPNLEPWDPRQIFGLGHSASKGTLSVTIEYFIRDFQISILPPCYEPPPIACYGEGDPTPAANPTL
jgi:hypothetical protein